MRKVDLAKLRAAGEQRSNAAGTFTFSPKIHRFLNGARLRKNKNDENNSN